MNTITTKDVTEIYYKDWPEAAIVTFSHRVQGCPKTLAPTPKRSRLRSSAGLDDLDDNIWGSEFVGQRLRKTFLYGILFRAAGEALRTIAADPKHLGAEIGFFAVLHTWG